MNTKPLDQAVRDEAINHKQSFIIQAPAGSGKTELLSQRYLNLLAKAVKNPEEIIAITFTRKATAEMRERIISALLFAKEHPEPQEDYKKITWQLATEVLAADQKNHWQLLSNPNRLRILTIDALNGMISTQIPLLSGFGAKPTIMDNAHRYYRNSVIEVLEQPGPVQAAVEKLLLHFENHAEQLITLLIQLLTKREQWLPHIFRHYHDLNSFKDYLQQSLSDIVSDTLQQAAEAIPFNCQFELMELAEFAAQHIDPEHPLGACIGLNSLPPRTPEYLPLWQSLVEILLTKQLEWRKTIDKRNGFPADKKDHKKRLLDLLNTLRGHESIRLALAAVIECPPSSYTRQQWQIIEALVQLLPQLTAQLHLQFQQHNVIDFVELNLGASRALGTENDPTDLALYLDYQIRHLLVDEFQDTSVTQFNLLNRLIQEWQPSDYKTLFLVGDPMQSIYRFRNAEVGLFLRAQQLGIANIQLKPLRLMQNFRSEAPIVDWINHSFTTIFPTSTNTATGAVPYNSSMAYKTSNNANAITFHAASTTDTITTAKAIVARIQHYQTHAPLDSIAILVRSRSHLLEIIPELNRQQIPYQAIELETLDHRPEIRDLVALTKALLHVGDRIAWLSLLRAPWAGIKLVDLHAICQHANKRPLWSCLQHFNEIPALSMDALQRLTRIIPQLAYSLHAQGRLPLAAWIKGTWLGLSGDACLTNVTEKNNVARYFQLLEEIQHDFSVSLLQQKIERLYAKPQSPEAVNLQLMTIHKSKGLEFDHVIIPELQKSAPPESNSLLMWLEYPNNNGDNNLVLAPIKANHEFEDPIHRYLKQLENTKLELELARLFYVATTRARKSLHLYCKLNIKEATGELQSPPKNTFLSLLWPCYANQFLASLDRLHDTKIPENIQATSGILRLPDYWPSLHREFDLATLQHISKYNAPTHLYERHLLSIVGTVIHEALQEMALSPQKSLNQRQRWQQRLLQLGVTFEKLPPLLNRIEEALKNTLSDPRGAWILQAHAEAHCEYSLTSLTIDDGFQTHIIDRTFLDAENVRWIIDYKSAMPAESENLSEFLLKQKFHHQSQLNQYASLMAAMENRTIKLGLYFPLCQGWVEWSDKT